VFGLSSLIGPTVGGWLTDGPGWRWAFYVNVPVGVLAVLAVAIGLPYIRSRAQVRDIDWLGVATLTAGLVPLLVALSITNTHAWSSPEVVSLLSVAGIALVLFFLVERRAGQPIVPFSLFGNNVFAISVLIAFFSALGMFGTILFVPLLYQGVLGVSATNSGQLLTPMMLGMIAFSTLAGQLMIRVRRYRYIGTVGVLLMMTGMALLTQVGVDTPQWRVAVDIVVVGAGLGITFPLTIVAVQNALPREYLGVASSQVQFWRNLGGTIGSAVLGSILARQLPGAIQTQIASLHLPPQVMRLMAGTGSGGGSPQKLFDPANLAAQRAKLPPLAVPMFDQVVHATRVALAGTLHQLFLISAAVMVVALIATLFLREVPLRSRGGPGVAAPPAPEAVREPEEVATPA